MKKDWKYLLIILFVILIFYSPIFFSFGKMLYPGWDWVTQHRYWKVFAHDSFQKDGQIPLWNPDTFAGTPYIGHPMASTYYYPLNILFLKLNPDTVFKFYLFFHLVMAGWAMFFLIKRLGFERIIALYGSLAFTLSGVFIARINFGQLTNIVVIAYVPLLMLLALRVWSKPKLFNSMIFGFVWGLQLLAGNVHLFYVSALGIGLFFIYKVISEFYRKDRTVREIFKRGILLLFAIVICVLVASGQLLTSMETAAWSIRTEATYDYNTTMSMPIWNIVGFVYPNLLGSVADSSYYGPENYTELYSYIGILPFLLAMITIFYNRKKDSYIWLWMSVIMLFLAFGKFTPVYWVAYLFIPGLNLFRIPATFLFMFLFFGIIYSCFGLDRLKKAVNNNEKQRAFYIFTGIFLVISVISYFLKPVSSIIKSMKPELINKYLTSTSGTALLHTIILTVLIVILLKVRFKAAYKIPLLIALFVIDLFTVALPLMHTEPVGKYFSKSPWLEKLKNEKGFFRIYDVKPVSQHMTQKYGIQKITGSDPIILKHYFKYTNEMLGLKSQDTVEQLPIMEFANTEIRNPAMLDMLNVKYLITNDEIKDTVQFRQIQKYNDEDKFVYLYENVEYYPRIWLSGDIKVCDNQEEALFLVSQIDNLKTTIICKQDLPDKEILKQLPGKATVVGNARISKYTPNMITIETDSTSPAMLVLSEVWMPGWKAAINDQRSKLYRVNYLLRGILIPQGKNKIEVFYYPNTAILGAFITYTTMILIITLIIVKLVRDYKFLLRPILKDYIKKNSDRKLNQ